LKIFDMRYATYLAAFAATTLALPAPPQEEIFTIELEGGERREVTETEKFALKAVRALRTYFMSQRSQRTGGNKLLRRDLLARLRTDHSKAPGRHLP
jgi:hypothetical protein